ncbi:molecular chaperone TorD [Vibrio sp. 10N.286.49.B3]|uniref:molecular chaperone TorD n=1 Tax=Vibrio sp. 10N.286.49.B3 TaxID=1880855 RepID=UPI000C86518D|nr:molecular chaperone TorD [Vibrio sp. 10N.286.49.B3]PMH44959.1 molecular chaperone TorD [Vibrio sp. 10N.286.49.B3]
MQEMKAFNEKRAEIYWWLSSLFAHELTQEQIEQYQSQTIRSFLSGLGENEQLAPSVEAFTSALNKLQSREDAQLELAADFCDLFLKSDKNAALPYASMYIGKKGLLNDVPAQEMEALLAKHNVMVNRDLNEPADHIAIELDFLGHLIIQSNSLTTDDEMNAALELQAEYINLHLSTWVPLFAQKCSEFDQFGFYASAAELLTNFYQLDLIFLTE